MSLSRLRQIAIGALVVALVVAATGIGGLRANSHYTAYFDSDDPQQLDNAEFAKRYSRLDGLLVILQSNGSFLDADNYFLLEDLTASLASHPDVQHAMSISELGIHAERVTSDGYYLPSQEQVMNDARAHRLLISDDARLVGVWMQVALSDHRAGSVIDAMSSIRETVAGIVSDKPVSVHYTGTLALNEAYVNVVRHDLRLILPLLLVTMLVVLGVLLNSLTAALTALPIGILSVIVAFGIAGAGGAELAAINAFAPIIILTISIAGCVHVALSYHHFRRRGDDPAAAALASARRNLLPMALANGTTALGFLALAFSPSPPIRMVGYLVAAGIFASFVFCLTLLPVLQQRFDPWGAQGAPRKFPLTSIGVFLQRYRTAIVAISLLAMLPAAWLASRNTISDNVFDYFLPSHDFHVDTKLVQDHLSGVNEMLFSMEGERAFAMLDAAAVDDLDRFTRWLEQQPQVNKVVSLSDAPALREARQDNRLQDRLDFYRSRLESNDLRHTQLALAVSADFSSSVISTYLQPMGSTALIDFERAAHDWAETNLGQVRLRSGGSALMFAHLSERNVRGMLIALVGTLLGSTVLLGIFFRSRRIAWVSLICNLWPVLVVYSVWAVTNGEINMGAAIVIGMVLGIVLDDSIYFLAAHQRGVANRISKPVEHALHGVGPALIITTLTLMTGLGLGLLSDFGPIWNMSILSIAIIGAALLVDLLLLPALLLASRVRRSGQ